MFDRCARVAAFQCIESEGIPGGWLLAVDCKDGLQMPPSDVHLTGLPGSMRPGEVLLNAVGHARKLRLAGHGGQAAVGQPSRWFRSSRRG